MTRLPTPRPTRSERASAPGAVDGPLRVWFDEALAPRADPAEVAWYEDRLPRQAGVLLQPLAGYGRLLVPLLERGFALHGVDPSPACLARCRASIDASAFAAELFRQEIDSLNLPFRYAAAFFAADTFQRLNGRQRALDALLRVRAHLIGPGLLLIQLFVPAEAAHPPGAAVVEWRTMPLADGSRIARRSETLIDVAARRSEVRSRFEQRRGASVTGREDEVREATWYTEEQAVELVAAAGYRDIRCEPLPSFSRDDGAARRFALFARL
jgi:hypothetical protein